MNQEIRQRVERAITALKQGQLIILTDDAQREHEGDLVGLASFATTENVNQALRVGRGVLCAPMSAERAAQLQLPQMVATNTEKFGTQFTVSVDHKGTTTGVSAVDRAQTLRELANLSAQSTDFERPGHIFPLVAVPDGVLARAGHTEAAVDLAKLAGVPPVAFIIEILDADGRMARETALADVASSEKLVTLTIAELIAYRQALVERPNRMGPTIKLPSAYGEFRVTDYTVADREPDLLIQSTVKTDEVPLVRLHSECLTGEVLGSYRCECGPQLHEALHQIDQQGGAIVYLRQEGRGIGLAEKLRTYVLQENGYDTFQANEHLGHQPDERDYAQAAQILKDAGYQKVRLLTNNPAKIDDLAKHGIEVVERVPLIVGVNEVNAGYMATKRDKFSHMI
ncbi:GTP cyclohydrolase II [Weissella cibaria]|uniref:GTP cyclohydrolase II n=1 Tax=Weissella cibaria TaxID=137591 RepID=UPI001371C7DF|nr:GTP cyclohydrolase II [Weissella cibaria]MYV36039.1 GTP cyclohydrolase II [Weissella cibaria]